MTIAELFIILGVAFLLSLLLAGAFGWRRHPGAALWPTVIFVFLILFPLLWLVDLWAQPVGPTFVGVYWVPLVVVGLILVLVLAAAVTPPARRTVVEVGETPTEVAVTATFGLFFWLLLLVLAIAIVAAYATA